MIVKVLQFNGCLLKLIEMKDALVICSVIPLTTTFARSYFLWDV